MFIYFIESLIIVWLRIISVNILYLYHKIRDILLSFQIHTIFENSNFENQIFYSNGASNEQWKMNKLNKFNLAKTHSDSNQIANLFLCEIEMTIFNNKLSISSMSSHDKHDFKRWQRKTSKVFSSCGIMSTSMCRHHVRFQ